MSIFEKERKGVSFNVERMGHVIYGSKENYANFKDMLEVLSNTEGLKFDDPNIYNKSREEIIISSLKKYKVMLQTVNALNSSTFLANAMNQQM